MARVSFDSFKIEDDGESAVLIRVVNSAVHNLGIQSIGPDSGNPYNEKRYIGQQNETFELTSTAIESLIDTISLLTGKCVVDGTTEVGLELFGQSHDPCGTGGRTAGSTHMKILAEHSHLLITGIQGNAGEDAIATVRAILLTDGTNPPSSAVFNVALPSSPIIDEAFTIGRPQVASTLFARDAVKSVALDTGLDLEVVTDVASIFPSVVIVRKVVPTLRIVVDDISVADTLLGEGMVACTLANSFFTYAKRLANGGIHPAASTVHIKVTFEGSAYLNDKFNASGRNVGTSEIVVEMTEPASGVPLTPTTGVAITI